MLLQGNGLVEVEFGAGKLVRGDIREQNVLAIPRGSGEHLAQRANGELGCLRFSYPGPGRPQRLTSISPCMNVWMLQ